MPTAASADGAAIYYESHGSGPGLLFVHGTGGHHLAWWQQVAEFRSDYTTVTVDLRGFGCSAGSYQGGPLAAELLVDDVLAVLAAVGAGPDSPYVLVGQSLGAVVALKAALRRPESVAGVVLGHSLGDVADEELTSLARQEREAAQSIPLLDRLITPEFQLASPSQTFLFQQFGTFNTAKIANIVTAPGSGPSPNAVATAGFPVVILAGGRDRILTEGTVRRAEDLIPGIEVVLVPDGPHSMYFEAPTLYNTALRSVLQRITATRESVTT